MNKTPEQMAEDWVSGRWYADHDPTVSGESKVAYLAGYQAAMDEMNSPQKPDGWNSSNNSNGWISVRERLPEPNVMVRAFINYILDGKRVQKVTEAAFCDGLWVGDGVKITHPLVSHWMPLPEPAK